MELNETTTYLFAEVTNLYRYTFEKSISELGLHSGQIFVLQLLFDDDGQNQIELASKLKVSAPTVNNMVKSLLNNSFVQTKACKKDGRMVRVYLTQKSRDLESSISEVWLKFEEVFFKSLTATEKLVLSQLLEKIKMDFNN